MIERTYNFVTRRVLLRDGTSVGRTFLWVIEHRYERVVRRRVIDYETGEIIDEAWLDVEGRIQTYTRPRPAGRNG